MAKTKKDPIKEFVEKIWPQTKKDFEKVSANVQKMLAQGEKYLKEVSEKGAEKTKKISLSLKREKLYYDLGKAVSLATMTKIRSNKKVTSLLKQIKDLDKAIKLH